MAACAKHTKTPAWGYSDCPGCEVERQREQIAALKAERDRYKAALSQIAELTFDADERAMPQELAINGICIKALEPPC